MSFYCWRCARRLDVVEAPKQESVTVLCPKCKAPNVVRHGHDPAEVVSLALDSTPPVMLKSTTTTA